MTVKYAASLSCRVKHEDVYLQRLSLVSNVVIIEGGYLQSVRIENKLMLHFAPSKRSVDADVIMKIQVFLPMHLLYDELLQKLISFLCLVLLGLKVDKRKSDAVPPFLSSSTAIPLTSLRFSSP